MLHDGLHLSHHAAWVLAVAISPLHECTTITMLHGSLHLLLSLLCCMTACLFYALLHDCLCLSHHAAWVVALAVAIAPLHDCLSVIHITVLHGCLYLQLPLLCCMPAYARCHPAVRPPVTSDTMQRDVAMSLLHYCMHLLPLYCMAAYAHRFHMQDPQTQCSPKPHEQKKLLQTR